MGRQMRGRRLEKTGRVFAEYVEDFSGPRTTQMPADHLPQQNGITQTGSYDELGTKGGQGSTGEDRNRRRQGTCGRTQHRLSGDPTPRLTRIGFE
jgi:hypothetical protein